MFCFSVLDDFISVCVLTAEFVGLDFFPSFSVLLTGCLASFVVLLLITLGITYAHILH